MLRNLLTVLFLTSLSTLTFSQTITSAQDGDWNDPNTWSPNTVPTSANSSLIEILNGHTVTVTAPITIDQTVIRSGGVVVINNGVTVTLGTATGDDININSGGTLNNNGTIQMVAGLGGSNNRMRINGILNNNGAFLNSSATKLIFEDGSDYFHLFDGTAPNSIPIAFWNTNSNVRIVGFVSGAIEVPSNLNQSFGNLIWNNPNQDQYLDLAGAPSSIKGNFQVEDTGAGGFYYNFDSGIGPNTNLSVGGSFILNGGTIGFIGPTGSEGILSVTGNFVATGGYLQLTEGVNATINVQGDVTIAGDAVIEFSPVFATAILNLNGNFSFTGGDIIVSDGVGDINFIGSSTKVFTSSIVPTGAVNYSVASLSTLVVSGSNFIGGNGSFTLSGTLQLGSTHAGGALQTGTANGNIRVPTANRTFNAGSTIVYNGVGAQFIGNGFPSSGGDVNLVINNTNGVTLSNDLEIVALRTLTLQSGNLVIGTQTLTINGTVTGSGGLIGGPSSNVVIGGTGNFGTLTFNGTSELLNFTVNRTSSGVVTLGGDLTVLGTLTQTAGDIVLNGNTLTLSGNFGRTSGNLVVDGASSLIVNGSGSLPPTVGLSGSSLQTLTLDRASSSFPFSASVTITNLNLIDGSLVNGTGLQITTGGTITRNAGTMSTSPGGSNLYNLDYITSGAINTGPEFHSNDARVDNVEMNGGGTVTLSADRTINGDLILSSGDFNIGSNTLTLEGNLIANSSSTLTGGTVVFDGNTTISGSAVPTFGNIQVNNTRSLTFPPGDFDVAGNVLFEAGSTINSGTGTLLLSGGAAQSISGGGVSISNIRVDKISGADVELTSPLIITGALRVVSANSNFVSDGNLVLRSTSDGTSNNARIGQLLNGASVSGDVTVERFMSAEGRIYRYISTPVSGFSVAELQLDFPVTGSFTGTSVCAGCTTNQSMFSYNGATQAYEDFPASSNTETLSAGVGYAAFIRQDVIGPPVTIDWTGPINQGTVPLPVSYNGTAESWNLVGNPYPSSIDWDNSGWTKTSIAGSISVRNNNTGMFQTWNGATGSLPNGVIATGQAFWVRTTGVTPSLQVTEPVKTTVTGEFFRKASDELNQFILTLSDGTVEDQAFYWVSEMASAGLDDYDAIKLNNFRDVGSVPLMDLATYSYDENPLPMAINSVNRVNCGDIVKVYTKDLIQGNYELSFSASGFISNLTWILKDNFTGTQINLSQNPIYGFVVTDEETSKAVDRFELSIAFNPVELTTYGNTLISNYETGNQWYLNGVLLEGETDKELVASESGLYTLEVNINGCISTTDRQFVVTNIENSIERTIRVYPNPTNDRFKLEVDSAEPVKARLFNTIGIEVTAVEMADSALTKNAEFDLSNQSNGIYILHVQKGGRVHQVKIIKTNK